MDNDFSLVDTGAEPKNDDFASVTAVEPVANRPARPLESAVLSVATVSDPLSALQNDNIALARETIEQQKQFGVRLGIAAKRQQKTMQQLNSLKAPGSPISAETRNIIDRGYNDIASQRIEDNARTSAETETVERIQDHIDAGETVEAKLAYNNFINGNAERVFANQATKNLVLGQYIEKLQSESEDEGVGQKVWNFVTSVIPFNYNFERAGIVDGASGGLKNWLLSGSGLQSQGDTLWGKYRDPKELAAALEPGGALDTSIRSNATTLGGFNPATAADIATNLNAQNDADKMTANAFGLLAAAELVPGVGAIDLLPFASRSLTKIPGVLTRLGKPSLARKTVADAFETVVSDGAEASMKRTGLSEADVAENLEVSALNPGASTEHAVPMSVDLSTHLEAAENVLRNFPEQIQVTRASTAEEIQHAYEVALKTEETKLGKSIKDHKFMYENIRTGEKGVFEPGILPEQGNVVHYVEYTVGKKSGGGFASRAAAVAEATKRGLIGPEIEGAMVEGKIVTNADRGFTQRVYHGTAKDFEDFDFAKTGSATGAENTKGVFFFSNDPDVALSYGRKAASAQNHADFEALQAKIASGDTSDATMDAFADAMEKVMDDAGAVIRPVDVNPSNLLEADMKGASYNGPITQSIIDEAKKQGKDGVIFKNYDDDILGGKASDVYALFNKEAMTPAFSPVQREVSGQFYIKGRANVREEGFFTTPLNTPKNNMLSVLRSDARRLDRGAQQKAVTAGMAAERVSSETQKAMKEVLKGISKEDKVFLDEVIRKGQNEERWLSEREFNSIFERASGKLPTDRVTEAYKSYRLFNDAEYLLRNDEVYKDLVIKGHETVKFKLPGDYDFEGAAIVKAEGQRPTERVYNVSDNVHYTTDNMLTAERWEALKGDGYLLVKSADNVTLGDGTVVRNFLIKRGDMSRGPLERMQLGYSEGGHRAYTGKYFAKQASKGIQPDTGQEYLKNPNVFRTGDNPNRLRDWAEVMNRAIRDADNGILDPQHYDDNVFINRGDLHFPTGQEFVDGIEKGYIDKKNPIEIVFDREMPTEYIKADERVARYINEDESAATGYYRSTGRMYNSRKGEALLDESGNFAETVDPWETMNKAMSNISRMSSLSNYKTSTLERFSRTYGQFLGVRDLDDVSPTALLSAPVKDGIPPEVVHRIKAEQAGIKRIMGFETGWEKGVRNANREFAEWVLGDARGGIRQTGHDFVHWLGRNNPVQALRSIAFDAKLGLFNMGQLLLQSSTIIAATSLHPRSGMKGIMSMIPSMVHNWTGGNAAILDVLTERGYKAMGFGSSAEMKEYQNFLHRTGFMNVGNTHLLINAYGPNRVFGAGSMIDGIREKGRAFFYMAEQMNRGVASRIAFDELKSQGLAVGSAEFREKFIGMADDLTFNMTNESSAAFQHGVFSIPTQFWAYNVRMMDAMFGKNFTGAQRARLIGGQLLFAGAGGVPVADALSDYLKRRNGEAPDVDTLLGTLDRGLADRALKELTGADVQFGSRVGTGTWLTDMVKDIFGLGDYGEKSPIETFGGATFSISAQLGKTMFDATRYAMSETGADQGYAITRENLLKLASNVSSFSNVNKALMVYNYGMLKSAKGSVQVSDLPTADAFAVALSLQPAELDNMTYMSAHLKDKQNIVKEAATQLRNWRQEAFNNPEVFEENMQKANLLVKMLPPDVQLDVQRQTNKITDKSFYEHIATKYNEEKAKEGNGE